MVTTILPTGHAPNSPPGTPSYWARGNGIFGNPIDAWSNSGYANGNVVSTGTARPVTGSLNGHIVASFDGTNDKLTGSLLISNVMSQSSYTVAAVFKPTVLSGSFANGFDAPAIVTDGDGTLGGNWFPMLLVASGVYGGHFSGGGSRTVTPISISAGNEYYAIITYNGTTITMTCNGVSNSLSTANSFNTNQPIKHGSNYNDTAFINAQVGEIVIYSSSLNTADQNTLKAYFKRRFPTAL